MDFIEVTSFDSRTYSKEQSTLLSLTRESCLASIPTLALGEIVLLSSSNTLMLEEEDIRLLKLEQKVELDWLKGWFFDNMLLVMLFGIVIKCAL